MRLDGSQAVVWQTAINPVVALELLAAGTWTGSGILGPEAFDAVPFLDLLTAYGSPWGMEDRTPTAVAQLSRTGTGSAPPQASSSRFGASHRAVVSRSRSLRAAYSSSWSRPIRPSPKYAASGRQK